MSLTTSVKKIVINDFREPVLTADQVRIMHEAEENPVDLSEEAVLSAAAIRAQSTDFGDSDFRERLSLVLDEVQSNVNLTELVRTTVFKMCVSALTNRLLINEFLKSHPEVNSIEIRRPIIIAGLPRSGTTYLQGLVASDSRLRSLPFWEGLQPIPLPNERHDPGPTDPRFLRAQLGWEWLQRLNPMKATHHALTPDHIHEDIELQMPNFSSMYWEWIFPAPRWRDHYLGHDQTDHYEYAKSVLKCLLWLDGFERRWVLKCTQHFEQLRPIMKVYPDALVVFTHRDPVASLQSIITQLAYINRTREVNVNPEPYIVYWTDRLKRMLQAYLRDESIVPTKQRVDVRFDSFVRDPILVVETIFDAAGMELTSEALAAIERFRVENTSSRYGEFDHDIERDFGVDRHALRAEFAFYSDKVLGAGS